MITFLMIDINRSIFNVVVLILLSVCTIIFFNHYERYQAVNLELLENADLLEHWKHSGTGITYPSENKTIAKLDASSPTDSPSLSQIIRPPFYSQLLRLSCDIKTQNIMGGDKYWKAARVILVTHNQEAVAMYSLPHILVHQRGNSNWTHYEKVFTIAPDTSAITVAAQLTDSTGTLWIKALSLQPVMLKDTFKHYRQLLLLVWITLLLWVAAPLIKSGFKSFKHGLVLLLATGIILGVLIPENLKESLGATWLASSTAIIAFIPTDFNDTQSFNLALRLPALDIYKAGHYTMFTFLSIALFGAKPYTTSTIRLLTFLVLFALVTEVLQLFMAGRTAQLADIFIDSCGITTGLITTCLYKKLKNDSS